CWQLPSAAIGLTLYKTHAGAAGWCSTRRPRFRTRSDPLKAAQLVIQGRIVTFEMTWPPWRFSACRRTDPGVYAGAGEVGSGGGMTCASPISPRRPAAGAGYWP